MSIEIKNQIASIQEFVLTSKTGMQLRVLNYGATISSLKVPLQNRSLVEVVLGFNSPGDYVNSFEFGHAPYFGAVVGRFAGRIRNAEFELNGRIIQLDKNLGDHHLHGGTQGFSNKIWSVSSQTVGDEPSITFAITSPHMDQNYPGELKVEVRYRLTLKGELVIHYQATSSEDTLVNLTQHSYFNLDGHQGDVTHQELKIKADKVLETDEENVPTGQRISLENHPCNFSKFKPVPSQIDDAFVLDFENDLAAELKSKKNDLHMKVYTNQPCLQVYVGGKIDSKLTSKGQINYHKTSGICFETQAFPDAPNLDDFPSAILKKDDVYQQHTKFQFMNLSSEHTKN
ncbi:aldose epimerase family protein [Psychroflexus sediminis]|uniref:Aldose 1-epimerase n=1 Tax=Psychroflexus sediminis TaxID=470826 RepID=A0A1G7WDL7_9FLAO|nr:aldose epimerase family protein [Psychroflexus sediminis]SDG70107.1 aldose 1-epimerase [Psychroflexus sediminis]